MTKYIQSDDILMTHKAVLEITSEFSLPISQKIKKVGDTLRQMTLIGKDKKIRDLLELSDSLKKETSNIDHLIKNEGITIAALKDACDIFRQVSALLFPIKVMVKESNLPDGLSADSPIVSLQHLLIVEELLALSPIEDCKKV